MKIILRDGQIVGTATDEYAGPDEFLSVADSDWGGDLSQCRIIDGALVYGEVPPQEVSIGQCRLALFDKHGIETDEQFYALADVLPEADRARARIELRTRSTVRYDNPLVIAFCAAMGWDRDALFIYSAAQ